MKLTALDIRKHEFARAFRGYDAEEVDAFLNMVAQHWQTMTEDMRRMEDRLEEQTQRVNHYLKVEEALEHALENARSMSEEKLGAAEEEAGTKLREAEARADETVREAEAQATESIRSADERASETIRAAEEEASRTLETAQREASEIMRAAAEARTAASEEFEALDGARKRVLDDLLHLLQSSLEAVHKYESDGTGPAIAAFSAALENAQATIEGDGVPSDDMPDLAEEPEFERRPLDQDSEELTSIGDATQGASSSVEPVDQTAGETVEQTADASNADMLANLPSADDSFEEAGPELPETPPQPEEDFGAEDEIRKIRRILEDLDS